MTVPVLETERLRMVAPDERHLSCETAFWASERSRFVGGPLPARRIWRLIAEHRGHWELRGYGSWMLEEKASGAALGIVGLWHPAEWPEPELGYHLYESAAGKGYAAEAGRAAIAHAYGSLGMRTLISLIDPENGASQAVARRLGGAMTGDTFRIDPEGPDLDIWRYPGPEEAR